MASTCLWAGGVRYMEDAERAGERWLMHAIILCAVAACAAGGASWLHAGSTGYSGSTSHASRSYMASRSYWLGVALSGAAAVALVVALTLGPLSTLAVIGVAAAHGISAAAFAARRRTCGWRTILAPAATLVATALVLVAHAHSGWLYRPCSTPTSMAALFEDGQPLRQATIGAWSAVGAAAGLAITAYAVIRWCEWMLLARTTISTVSSASVGADGAISVPAEPGATVAHVALASSELTASVAARALEGAARRHTISSLPEAAVNVDAPSPPPRQTSIRQLAATAPAPVQAPPLLAPLLRRCGHSLRGPWFTSLGVAAAPIFIGRRPATCAMNAWYVDLRESMLPTPTVSSTAVARIRSALPTGGPAYAAAASTAYDRMTGQLAAAGVAAPATAHGMASTEAVTHLRRISGEGDALAESGAQPGHVRASSTASTAAAVANVVRIAHAVRRSDADKVFMAAALRATPGAGAPATTTPAAAPAPAPPAPVVTLPPIYKRWCGRLHPFAYAVAMASAQLTAMLLVKVAVGLTLTVPTTSSSRPLWAFIAVTTAALLWLATQHLQVMALLLFEAAHTVPLQQGLLVCGGIAVGWGALREGEVNVEPAAMAASTAAAVLAIVGTLFACDIGHPATMLMAAAPAQPAAPAADGAARANAPSPSVLQLLMPTRSWSPSHVHPQQQQQPTFLRPLWLSPVMQQPVVAAPAAGRVSKSQLPAVAVSRKGNVAVPRPARGRLPAVAQLSPEHIAVAVGSTAVRADRSVASPARARPLPAGAKRPLQSPPASRAAVAPGKLHRWPGLAAQLRVWSHPRASRSSASAEPVRRPRSFREVPRPPPITVPS